MIRNTYTILMLLLCVGIGCILVSCDPPTPYQEYHEQYYLQTDAQDTLAEGDTLYIRYCGNYYHLQYLRHNYYHCDGSIHYHQDKSTLVMCPQQILSKEEQWVELWGPGKNHVYYWFPVNGAFYTPNNPVHLSKVLMSDSVQLYCNSELLTTWTFDNTETTYKNIYAVESWEYTELPPPAFAWDRYSPVYTYFIYTYTLGRSDIEEFRKRKGQ